MKKASKRALRKQIRRDVKKAVRRDIRRDIGRKVGKKAGKVVGKLLVAGLILFVSTFALYMLNLENKLIYNVIYPFLQKHYNSQSRDRRI